MRGDPEAVGQPRAGSFSLRLVKSTELVTPWREQPRNFPITTLATHGDTKTYTPFWKPVSCGRSRPRREGPLPRPTSPPSTMTGSHDALELAREVGFDLAGIAPLIPPPGAERFERWLDAGHHAGMAWLERNRDRITDPRHLLPGGRSLLVVGLSHRRGAVELPGPPGLRWRQRPLPLGLRREPERRVPFLLLPALEPAARLRPEKLARSVAVVSSVFVLNA